MNEPVKIAFITNLCPTYRVKAFQGLAKRYDVDFYFYCRPEDSRVSHLEIVSDAERFHYLTTAQILMRLFTQNYPVVIKCSNGKYITLLSFLTAKLMRKKFIFWHSMWYTPQTLFRRFSMPVLKWIFKYSDAVVVYGEHGKKYLESHGVEPRKIFIAWQSVDNELFAKAVPAKALSTIRGARAAAGKKVVLFVGRFVEEKGVSYLIEAVAQLKDDGLCLMLVGEGPLKEALEKQCVENRLDCFVFVGKVPNSELYKYYALADVFVLPSITTREFKEPWGLVVNEAMNQGTPVVVTDAVGAGVGGLVQEGVNGFVVPERDSQSLSVALRKIISDDALRAAMGQNAKRVIKDWTYERMVEGFTDAIAYAQGAKK
ncbi:MAG TPA: glycosyltransferase family 4 protein [Nitrospiria bacterium]|nr:glycosyltransferase family 4 protein [Nitrospiria bacterium]HUK56444.1 glycosyltransferase family 4 protein [Nitrospiria bacterium]